MAQKAEKMLLKIINEWLCNAQLFPKVRIIDKSVSDVRIRIRFSFESSFDIRILLQTHYLDGYPTGKPVMIISGLHQRYAWTGLQIFWIRTPAASNRIRSLVFLPVAGTGLDLDFVLTEKTLLVVYFTDIQPHSNRSRIPCNIQTGVGFLGF